ncbi:MAG: nitroreductase family protein [Prevotellaceae bacterium]|nr:nitroreductase family protein [Prevotellaceae bacterium]
MRNLHFLNIVKGRTMQKESNITVETQNEVNMAVKDGETDIVNNTVKNIHARKSVRKYTEQKVSEEDLLLLVKAGMAAPTGKNMKPWHFITVRNRETLDTMSEQLPYAKMLRNVSAAIVVCGDTQKSQYWYLDCSAATQNILLAAESVGFGAVWTAAYPYEDRIAAVNACLNIPEGIVPLCVIPVGYPQGTEKPKDKWDETKYHKEKW